MDRRFASKDTALPYTAPPYLRWREASTEGHIIILFKIGASRQMSANEVRGRSPIGANEVRGRSPIGLRSLYKFNNERELL